MKVSDLIALLSALPQDAHIVLEGDGDRWGGDTVLYTPRIRDLSTVPCGEGFSLAYGDVERDQNC